MDYNGVWNCYLEKSTFYTACQESAWFCEAELGGYAPRLKMTLNMRQSVLAIIHAVYQS